MRQNRFPGGRFALLLSCVVLSVSTTAIAVDWPTWRRDANRSATTKQRLGKDLKLQWTRQLPPSEPAWPEDPRLHFDANGRPVISGVEVFAEP